MMITARLSTDESPELWMDADPAVRVKGAFPLNESTGTESSAVVYFELEPGCALGSHTDSAEEILLILDGTVEVTLGEEKGRVSRGELALVPEMVPHNVRNVGTTTAKVAGFFSSSHVVSTFEHAFAPPGQQVFDTAQF